MRPRCLMTTRSPSYATFCSRDGSASHQTPAFGIEAHGSAGGSEPPFWMSSIEIASGVRTVRLALEMRRRVKEQQKRIGTAEFRNTQFSYSLGADGVEHFVATPELQSENSIGGDPLPAGQAWAISPGEQKQASKSSSKQASALSRRSA